MHHLAIHFQSPGLFGGMGRQTAPDAPCPVDIVTGQVRGMITEQVAQDREQEGENPAPPLHLRDRNQVLLELENAVSY